MNPYWATARQRTRERAKANGHKLGHWVASEAKCKRVGCIAVAGATSHQDEFATINTPCPWDGSVMGDAV